MQKNFTKTIFKLTLGLLILCFSSNLIAQCTSAPSLQPDNASTCPNTTVTGDYGTNDSGYDDIRVRVVTNGEHGSASLNSFTLQFEYEPDYNYCGLDSIQYRVCNGGYEGQSNPACCDTTWIYITVGDSTPPVIDNEPSNTSTACSAIPSPPEFSITEDCFIDTMSFVETSTEIGVGTPDILAHWTIDDCALSIFNNGGLGVAVNQNGCLSATASNVTRVSVGNSCNDRFGYHDAICFNNFEAAWVDNSDEALDFSFTAGPSDSGKLTMLQFDEQQFLNFNSGLHNYPQYYGVRVLKNGVEIYKSIGNPTSPGWSTEVHYFNNDADFIFSGGDVFSFEILGYDATISDDSAVWEVDEIRLYGYCGSTSACDQIYTITRTWECTDVCGNTETYTQEIIVTPTTPVEMTYFEGRAKQCSAALEWETASEEQNDYFMVEHSFDGRTFNSIGIVKGHGTTSVVQNYTFEHENVRQNLNHYRLKQVDYDGTFAYSDIVSVNSNCYKEERGITSIFPNPTTGEVKVKFYMENAQDVELIISDMMGRTITSSNIQLNQGNNLFDINMTDQKSGIYFIQMKNEGWKSQTFKIIKLD